MVFEAIPVSPVDRARWALATYLQVTRLLAESFLEVIDFVCNIFIIFATNISCYP